MTTVRVKIETGELDMSGEHEHRGRCRFYPNQADKAGKAGIMEKTIHACVKPLCPHGTHDMPSAPSVRQRVSEYFLMAFVS